MQLNALNLARLQFTLTVSFHIIFPAITIGLASFLMVLEAFWLKTGNELYKKIYRFWIRIFAVSFGIGIVTGVVIAYEFGTNWSLFAERGGEITGVILTLEVLTAFFLEAGFLGVMVFGEHRVSKSAHFLSTSMVTFGTLISATWILVSNSWMQTPSGFELVNGRFSPVNWLHIIFNPSFTYRLIHMVFAALISVSFLVAGVGSYHLLRNSKNLAARKMLSMAMWMILVTVPIQIWVGDLHGLNTLEYQPAKIAAMEGYFGGESDLSGVPLTLAETKKVLISMQHLASIYLTHTWNGKINGLKDYLCSDLPNVQLVFLSFRLMVGIGLLMQFLGVISVLRRCKKDLYTSRKFNQLVIYLSPVGFVALIAGWVTTEAGRQPWVVYGFLRTEHAVSSLAVGSIRISIILFLVVYPIILMIGMYYILQLVRRNV